MIYTDEQAIELGRREAVPWAERAQALAAAQVERQLPLLGELAELGLEVARAVERAARAWTPAQPASKPPEPVAELPESDADTGADIDEPEPRLDRPPGIEGIALAYARVSRSVRLTIALQSRLVKDLEDLHRSTDKRDRWKDMQVEVAGHRERDARKEAVARVALRLAYAEKPDQERADSFYKAAKGWMESDRYADLTARPMSEVVAQICKDMGLKPNWTFLAQDAWARAEIASGKPGEPLRAHVAPPVRRDEPRDDPADDAASRFIHARRWRARRRPQIRAGPS